MNFKKTKDILNNLADSGEDILPFRKIDNYTHLGQLTTMNFKKKTKIKKKNITSINYRTEAWNLTKKLTFKLRIAQRAHKNKTTKQHSLSENKVNFKILLKQLKK